MTMLTYLQTILRDSMLYVANEFTKEGQKQYEAAAKAFRLPYWGKQYNCQGTLWVILVFSFSSR